MAKREKYGPDIELATEEEMALVMSDTEDDETDDEVVLFEFGDLHESHADNQNETTCTDANETHDNGGDEPQVILL